MTPAGGVIAIDFGTTHTAVAVDDGSGARAVRLDGRTFAMPSCVLLDDDGSLVVGTAAERQAAAAPERFEPTPKRSLGMTHVELGDTAVEVTDLIAAVLRHAGACAREQAPNASVVRLTHPASWGPSRREVLRLAAQRAGLAAATDVQLVAEPIAAALHAGVAGLQPGSHVAVYDFGGGTFDAAVLRVTATGVELAGPPRGRDPLGGEDIDQRILDYLVGVLGETEGWERLMSPETTDDRRDAALLRRNVRETKEILSGRQQSGVIIPRMPSHMLSQPQFEELIAADIDDTIDVLAETIAAAGLDRVDRIVLTGGSSRIPRVARIVWERFDLEPFLVDEPKLVVALGATSPAASTLLTRDVGQSPDGAAGKSTAVETTAQPGEQPTFVWKEPVKARVRSRLAATTFSHAWPMGAEGFGYLTLEGPGGQVIRVADAPTETTDLSAFALAMREVLQRHHGPELRLGELTPTTFLGRPAFHLYFWVGGDAMLQRYAIDGNRTLMVTAPAHAGGIVDSMRIGPSLSNPRLQFELRVELPSLEPGWSYSERLVLVRRGSRTRVTCRSVSVEGVADMAWTEEAARDVGQRPGHFLQARKHGRFLGGRPCVEFTFNALEASGPMRTKFSAAVIDGRGYSVSVTLRPIDLLGYSILMRGIVLRG